MFFSEIRVFFGGLRIRCVAADCFGSGALNLLDNVTPQKQNLQEAQAIPPQKHPRNKRKPPKTPKHPEKKNKEKTRKAENIPKHPGKKPKKKREKPKTTQNTSIGDDLQSSKNRPLSTLAPSLPKQRLVLRKVREAPSRSSEAFLLIHLIWGSFLGDFLGQETAHK